MNRLSGKKAIITGGAKGIGFSTAKFLLSEGCDITVWDKDKNGISELKSKLSQVNKKFLYISVM